MPKIGKTIRTHNRKVTEGHTDGPKNETKTCSYRSKDKCPLNGRCLQKSLIYQATVSTDAETYRYIGLTEHSFKQRFTNHNQSFRHQKCSNSTELSKLIWKLKNSKTNYNITRKVLQSSIPYKIGGSKWDLCLSKKLHIIKASYPIINKRTELISKCRHKNKFSLRTVKL